MMEAEQSSTLPPCPRVVLRVGFAGRRNLTADDEARLAPALDRVLGSIGRRLAALTPGVPVAAGSEPRITGFYDATRPPLLRLITGLCEGADTAAVLALERLDVLPDTGAADPARPCLATELAAVLPFGIQRYRASRHGWFLAEFDRQAEACSYIVELDGIHEKPEPDTDLAAAQRKKGYRAQSAMLLRQADLLVAAADPRAPGKAGGTLETIAAALRFGLPVIFIDSDDASIRLLEPDDDLDSVLFLPPPADAVLDRDIDALVRRLVADPALEASGSGGGSDDGSGSKAMAQLTRFFEGADVPPAPEREYVADRWRKRAWTWLKGWLERGSGGGAMSPPSAGAGASAGESAFDETLSPYHRWRDRARKLNHHYGGLYRGAFVLGYGLAVAAVLLAGLSLVLLGEGQSEAAKLLTMTVEAIEHAPQTALAGPGADVGADVGAHAGQPAPRDWLVPTLLLLGFAKLAIVWFIARNTQRANAEHWSDLAVDYRYLAERLRAMYYLPLAGSFQPPPALAAQYASRVARQSAVDWLFDAILRSVSPADFGTHETLPGWNGGTLQVRVVRPRPRGALAVVREHWVRGQVAYHADNARVMGRLDRLTERAARRLSSAVVAVVMLDLGIVAWELAGTMPASVAPRAHLAAPWLMFLVALLPAAVAALSGLRFQSECRRLAERSAHLARLLGGRPEDDESRPTQLTGGRWQQLSRLLQRIEAATSAPAQDLGGWSADALLATERVARDCAGEVAEWSVLYAKELPET